jgi:hypothetical protein
MVSPLAWEQSSDPAFEALSPTDKELVHRLKRTYFAEVLAELFSEPSKRMFVLFNVYTAL